MIPPQGHQTTNTDLDRALNLESGFTYPPIDPKTHIRLLRPSPKASAGELDFAFEIVHLDRLSDIRYKALSYTWGRISTSADLHTVKINNQPFLVRKNLFDFLNSNPFSDDQALIPIHTQQPHHLVFIDALCINQFDSQERQSQVQLMTQIYRRSTSVIAWLGLPPPSLLPSIQSLASISPTLPPTSWTPSQLSAHNYLSNHPYWTRLWVLQELLFAPTATIRCGPSSFPLRHFSSPHPSRTRAGSPAERLTTHRLRALPLPRHDPLHMGTTILPLSEMVKTLSDTPYYKIHEYQSPVPDTLQEIFTHYGHLECSDPRDKLYGFLGLLSAKSRKLIRADYEKGVDFAFYQSLKVGLGEVAREVESDMITGEYEGVNGGWIGGYYKLVGEVFGMDEEEGRRMLKKVVKELRLEEWLAEVAVVVGAGWRVGGVVSLGEIQRGLDCWDARGESGRGEKGWLERLHGRQESAARRIGGRFGRARVVLRV
ncbi:heterokaryon incompatibility protein-domain-containing protein [Immersiella caudata]|uniref:Heterokaryon incompatibility protein-domain-containing protein n=1 Tax=Immersiella caudata TaxID=314043 RepID=A0AA39WC70_9PEZI|nr:heterokaryon incompatibility protein-domain-containing protein [Immersiella caudata]